MASAKKLCEKCGTNRLATSYPTPRARICTMCQKATRRRSSKAARLGTLYGITMEDYEKILASQGGVCAGCGQKRSYALHVDHDHAVERALLAHGIEASLAARGSVRGLLCRRCNKILRDIRDSIPNLRQLADYLAFPPAKGILT